ncbi:MAG: phosphorylase [Stigonema ocellatum SAG 48.90 = DSM 106950]|nr:phosphorylase [Stigonema ocellatum SAG 48.90 = DSM 106950]
MKHPHTPTPPHPHTPIQTILVCQGAEYKAVCRGLRWVFCSKPSVMPMPVGIKPLTRYLQTWLHSEQFLNHPQPSVLVMGLCGSLIPRYQVGDIVLYQDCVYQVGATSSVLCCNSTLTKLLYSRLQEKVPIVKALTSDRLVSSATEKSNLGQMSGADVVDMEGFAALELLSQAGVAVAMLRVVSDNCYYDIPDLTQALSSDGSLQPLPLALAMLRQPIAATRLIRGSLRGLKVLEKVTGLLFSSSVQG